MPKPALRIIGKILKYALITIIGVVLITALLLINKISASKDYYSQMSSGKNQLDQAITSIKTQKYSNAENQANSALAQFNSALTSLAAIKENKVAAYFSPISTSVDDLEYLTKTAQILSKSLVRSAAILTRLDTVTSGRFTGKFSDLSDYDRQQILSIIYQSSPELNGLNANIQLSLEDLSKIHRIGILLPINSKLDNIKSQLTTASDLLGQLAPLTQLLPVLSGYPQESEFLVILQNNDELRPTGGFIGTYGIMTIKDGKPGNIVTEDVYHLDMPCIGKLTSTPPDPVKKYMGVEYWWLRDANFSPDFPTSAKQVESMFLAESECAGKEAIKPAAVIAINPGLISDLLSLVGPITVQGTTYDSNNFQSLLQYNVEVAYVDKNISSWDRKEVINAVVSELKTRLMSLPTKRLTEVLNIVKENTAKRNLQIYFDNEEQEQIAKELNLTGEIKKPNNDYLMVVDANLGAYKSDSVIRKNISYQIQSAAQQLTATVTLKYKHEGGFDWRTTRYRSYTRIYAPLGSQIKDSGGLDDFSATDDASLGKTVFGFFWTIEPSEEKTATISYTLPKTITAENYNLYFQKQSGSRLNNFNYKNAFNSDSWSGTLDRDKIFE